MKIIILLAMIYCHIINDYLLQGILASMKQYKWWINHEGFNPKYNKDYIAALVCHAFSWTFTMSIPILIYRFNQINYKWAFIFMIAIIINTIIHAIVDDLKANKYKLNLIQDQLLHMAQIGLTFLLVIGDIL